MTDDEIVRAIVPRRTRTYYGDGNPRLLMPWQVESERELSRAPRVRSARFRPCEAPCQMGPGEYFSCGKCEPCLERRRYDAVGRILAESWTSARAFFMTMTIGGDRRYGSTASNPKAQALVKPDVQAANHRLRKYICHDAKVRWAESGRDPALFVRPWVRYFYVGELGDRFGRPHYHQILFLQGEDTIPDLVLGRGYFHGKMDQSCAPELYPEVDHVGSDRTYWPFGTTFVEEFERRNAYYVACYCVPTPEQRRDEPSPWLVMRPGRSVRPILGAGYFDDIARRTAEQGLPLQDDGYRLPVMDPNYSGPSALHHMNRSTKMFLVDRYRHHWVAMHGGGATQRELPRSEFMDRVFAVEGYRKLRVYSEAEKFFQDCKSLLELNQAKAADAVERDLVGAYAAIKAGTRIWG